MCRHGRLSGVVAKTDSQRIALAAGEEAVGGCKDQEDHRSYCESDGGEWRHLLHWLLRIPLLGGDAAPRPHLRTRQQQLSSKVMQRPPEIAADMGGLGEGRSALVVARSDWHARWWWMLVDNESRRWWGGMVMLVGVATPIVAIAVYVNGCQVQRCSGTVSALCIFVSPGCDLDFVVFWFWSSAAAVALIVVGVAMGRGARSEMRQECVGCGHRKTAHTVTEPKCNVPDCTCPSFVPDVNPTR